jgi:hypothetical protein
MSGDRKDAASRRSAGDRGSVTVEMAFVLPVLVMLAALGVAAVVVATYQLGCVARARDTALAVARGEEASSPGGPGHVESIRYGDDGTVTATVKILETTCTSTAAMEP